MCEADWKGGALGSTLYFSWCLALMVVPRQADKFGRKWIFMVSRVVECLLFVASLFVTDYWTMVVILAGFGLMAAGRINVGTVYMTEWLPRKNQTQTHVIHHGGQSISYVLYTIFFWLLSHNTVYVSAFGCTVCLVTTALAFLIPESPRLAVAKGNVEAVRQSLEAMARINRTTFKLTANEEAWIRENATAAKEKKNGRVQPVFGHAVEGFVLADSPFVLHVLDVPEETSEPELRRMLTKGSSDAGVHIEMAELENVEAKKKKIKRALTYQLSFATESEMLEAHRIIQKHNLKVQIVDVKISEKNNSDKDTDERASDERQSSSEERQSSVGHEDAHSEPVINDDVLAEEIEAVAEPAVSDREEQQSEGAQSEPVKRVKLSLPIASPEPVQN